MQSSVAFTLPISCQICWEKVKEPVTCPNQHVFCSSCMNVWLDRNSRCPACRVEITSQSPLRKIIGGVLQTDETKAECRITSRELRRARFEISLREYEDEIRRLENEVDRLTKENESLKKQSESDSNSRSPASCSFDSFDKHPDSCSRCCNIKDLDEMLDLSKKLQKATSTYTDVKEQLARLKKVNERLVKSNDDLTRENQRIRMECDTRSPLKYGRLTVATLESRLDSAHKEVEQLKKAMERNDTYTESLEQELKSYRSTVKKNNKKDDPCKSEPIEGFPLNVVMSEPPHKDILSQACDVVVSSSDLRNSSWSVAPPCDVACSIFTDESSKASSFFELQAYDGPFPSFTSPAPSSDATVRSSSFSRKLDFDASNGTYSSSSQELGDLFRPVNGNVSVEIDQNRVPSQIASSNLNSGNSVEISKQNETNSRLQPSPVTKTVINAGGSFITMSQLSADDHDAFSRPSSAPSRTFLLSGTRFSALRPLDPPTDNTGFQPVKCISPMHMMSCSTNTVESDKRPSSPMLRMVSPDDVIDAKYRKNDGGRAEEEIRGREVLSRVNILKRRNLVKTPVCAPTISSVTEGRRKQRLYQKKGVDICFQSPLKSPRMQPR